MTRRSLIPRPRRGRRDGITFYEVFLALILLVAALAVLGQHVGLGVRAADDARLRTLAEELATAKLNEVLAGIEPLQTVSDAPLEAGDGGWTYGVEVAAGPAQGLLDVRVTVAHADGGLSGIADESFALRQLIRDPAVLLDAEVAGAVP